MFTFLLQNLGYRTHCVYLNLKICVDKSLVFIQIDMTEDTMHMYEPVNLVNRTHNEKLLCLLAWRKLRSKDKSNTGEFKVEYKKMNGCCFYIIHELLSLIHVCELKLKK